MALTLRALMGLLREVGMGAEVVAVVAAVRGKIVYYLDILLGLTSPLVNHLTRVQLSEALWVV